MLHMIMTWVLLKHIPIVHKGCVILDAHVTFGPLWLVERFMMMSLAPLSQ